MKRTLLICASIFAFAPAVFAASWPMWGTTNAKSPPGRSPPPPVYLPGASAPAVATTNQVFWFGHFAFNQAMTPTAYVTMAPGSYNYAQITEPALSVTSGVNEFPEENVGFDPSLSVGELFIGGNGSRGARALNLRGGDHIFPGRSGFTMSWEKGLMLTNQAGVSELVIYESGGFGGPEAFMVQVHVAGTAIWSDWVYQTESNFTAYNGRSTAGAYATVFDLDMFGVLEGERVDSMRIASMNTTDRMQSALGSGVVIPNDNGKTSINLPDPGRTAIFRAYDISSFDPDILYIGVLHNQAPGAGLASVNGAQ